jgi:aarF domain-containing kinase
MLVWLNDRKVLVMDFIDGTPILKLGDEMARRGINPNGSIAKLAKRSELVYDFLILL